MSAGNEDEQGQFESSVVSATFVFVGQRTEY